MPLRPYQQAAVDDTYAALGEHRDNLCIVIPTAGGKSHVIAQLAGDVVDAGGRVVILAHVKELLEQNRDKLLEHRPDLALRTGIYSAGLRRRQLNTAVVIAGIQSIYQRGYDLGHVDLVLIDEAHRIPPTGDGMYQRFLTEVQINNPRARLVGLTATPYRMASGWLCGPDNLLNRVCHETGVKELIDEGYITRPISYGMEATPDLAGVHTRGGEFVQEELQAAVDLDWLVEKAVGEIVKYTTNRKSVLVFASGVDHGEHIADLLNAAGSTVGQVYGHTPSERRSTIISLFKSRDLKYLVNCDVLTTGFDAPNIDAIAMLRPTQSPGLYYQMCGRGFRLYEGKTDCMVLDFGGNVARHGFIDAIEPQGKNKERKGLKPTKLCELCRAINPISATVCEVCGAVFEVAEREPTHKTTPDASPILSPDGMFPERRTEPVKWIEYEIHTKKRQGPLGWETDPDKPEMLKVTYHISSLLQVTEYVLIEHTGWAYQKAVHWWQRRSHAPTPSTAAEAIERKDSLATCTKITWVPGDRSSSIADKRFDRIRSYELGEIPEYVKQPTPAWPTDWEVPF